MDEEHMRKIAKRLLRGKYTLRQLDIGIGEIREMKEQGYNIRSETEKGNTYYTLYVSPDQNYAVHSGRSGTAHRVGILRSSDWHGGSKMHKQKEFRWALQQAVDRGYVLGLFSGDAVDGFGVYKGHVNYLKYTRLEDQVSHVVETLKEFEDKIVWYGIDGNHDMNWIFKGAPSPTKMVSERVKNFHYIPNTGADRVVRGDIIIHGTMHRLVHPWSHSSRGTYARSYPAQTYLRNLMAAGVTFNIGDKKYLMSTLQYGHLHYDMNFQEYGVHITHPMSFQGSNDFTEGKGLTGPTGVRLEKLLIQDGEITRYSSRPLFVPDNL